MNRPCVSPEQVAELIPEMLHVAVDILGVQIDFLIHQRDFKAGFLTVKSSQRNALPAGNKLVRSTVHGQDPCNQEKKRQRCRCNISLYQNSPLLESLYSIQRYPPDQLHRFIHKVVLSFLCRLIQKTMHFIYPTLPYSGLPRDISCFPDTLREGCRRRPLL